MDSCFPSSSSKAADSYGGKQKRISRKLVVLGDGACGKTSMLSVFTKGYFPTEYEPTVFENYVSDVRVNDTLVELSLWDTAGQEEFDRLRSLSYADTHIIMACYSVSSRPSLENIESKWLPEIREYCPGVKIILVACKCDLRDQKDLRGGPAIGYEEGLEVAKKIRASRYLECSAKHNRGVVEAFDVAAFVAIQAKPKGGSGVGNTSGSSNGRVRQMKDSSCIVL